MRKILGLTCLLMLAGCGGTVRTKHDAFYNADISSSKPIVLSETRFDLKGSGYISIVIERVQTEGSAVSYDFKIRCGPSRSSIMEVESGDSLLLVMGSQGIRYNSASGSYGGVPAEGMRRPEKPFIIYEGVPLEDLQTMAKAEAIRVKITGVRHTVTGEFSGGNLSTLREYLQKVEPAKR